MAKPNRSGKGAARFRHGLVLIELVAVLAVSLRSGAARADVFSLDDGSREISGGTAGGDLLALNHFDTAGRTVLIDQISVFWGAPFPRYLSHRSPVRGPRW